MINCNPRPFTKAIAAQQEFHDLVMENMVHGPYGPTYGQINLDCCQTSNDGT